MLSRLILLGVVTLITDGMFCVDHVFFAFGKGMFQSFLLAFGLFILFEGPSFYPLVCIFRRSFSVSVCVNE